MKLSVHNKIPDPAVKFTVTRQLLLIICSLMFHSRGRKSPLRFAAIARDLNTSKYSPLSIFSSSYKVGKRKRDDSHRNKTT
jgi:hypothetical protein